MGANSFKEIRRILSLLSKDKPLRDFLYPLLFSSLFWAIAAMFFGVAAIIYVAKLSY